MRRKLPQRRAAETFSLRFWNQPFTVTVGRFSNGSPAEIFIDGGKTGQDVQSTARDAAVVSPSLSSTARPSRRQARGDARVERRAASILGAVVDALPATGRGAA